MTSKIVVCSEEIDRKFYTCTDCKHEFYRDTKDACPECGSLSYYWMFESERETEEDVDKVVEKGRD